MENSKDKAACPLCEFAQIPTCLFFFYPRLDFFFADIILARDRIDAVAQSGSVRR